MFNPQGDLTSTLRDAFAEEAAAKQRLVEAQTELDAATSRIAELMGFLQTTAEQTTSSRPTTLPERIMSALNSENRVMTRQEIMDRMIEQDGRAVNAQSLSTTLSLLKSEGKVYRNSEGSWGACPPQDGFDIRPHQEAQAS